ncbi:MAG: signal peptide peptidase SppA [Puniceicoccales bacterium]|jgi:protease-4|nr:signal peptide peptidase SppA [Puniceicoccales bacterium]
MKSFFKNLAASILGNLIACGAACVVMFFFFFIFLAVIGSSGQAKVHVPKQSFLVLDLNMSIADAPEHSGGSLGQLIGGGGTPRIALWDLMRALDAGANDKRISGLFITGSLVSENYGSGFAALEEVRRAIEDFKQSGKPVIAYLENPSLKDYYLSTTADTIYLHPYSALEIKGMATQSFYLAGAFKKYGIGVQTTKVGKYKSAVEPFISEKMSDYDREQRQMMVGGIWNQVASDIAKGRKLNPKSIQEIADTKGILDAATALDLRLVDHKAYLDEVITVLKNKGTEDRVSKSFAQVNIRDYANSLARPNSYSGTNVAIVYAEGDIVDGWDNVNSVGGDWLAAELRRIRQDENVAAVVLRVNSPGGSAFASENIQREVRLTNDSGKPVIISMGSLAASGGYWISAYSNKIYAEKTTITGSIGVFGLMFNFQDLAKNVGIAFDGVKTARYADIEDISRPKNAEELALMQKLTDQIYDAFLDKVAEGRSIERATVAKIAEGRVWVGSAAKEIQLVDEFGGLREAVAEAARQAGMGSHYSVVQYPERKTAMEALTESLTRPEGESPVAKIQGNSPAAKVTRQVGDIWTLLQRMNDKRGIYARIPYQEDIE